MNALARLNRLMLVLSGIALAIIVLVTLADVLAANLRGRPMTGVYDVVETSLVYLVFLGLPETFRSESNISVDLVDRAVSPKVLAFLRTAGALSCAVYLGLLEWSMIGPAWDAYRFSDYKADSGIPYWFIWAPILVGVALAFVAAVMLLRRRNGGAAASDATS